MGSCQKHYILWLFDTSFVCTKEGRPLGGSMWKLQEIMLVSWFLAYIDNALMMSFANDCFWWWSRLQFFESKS
jgi:hypothetical protein